MKFPFKGFKYLKIRYFLGLLLVFVFLPVRAGWITVQEFNGPQFKGHLEYDSQSKTVKLYYKRKRNWGDFIPYGPFKVGSPTEVDQSMAELEDFLKRQLFSSEVSQSLMGRIEEFKFIAPVGCQAIFFEKAYQGEDSISELIQKVSPITNSSQLNNPSADALRSLLLEEFPLENGRVQLRMVLDQNGNFLKFSFAKERGNLENYKIALNAEGIELFSPEGARLIELRTAGFNGEQGFLEVKAKSQKNIFGHQKTIIKLEKGEDWSVDVKGPEDFDQTVIKEGVALTSTIAEHESVIQLQDSEIAFSRMDKDLFSKVDFVKDESERKTLEALFNNCMAETLTLAQREGAVIGSENIQEQAIEACHKRSLVQALATLSSEYKKAQACLERKEVLASSNRDFYSVGSLDLDQVATSVNECWNELGSDLPLSDDGLFESIKENPQHSAILNIYNEGCDECQEEAKSLARIIALQRHLGQSEEKNECLNKRGLVDIRNCALNYYKETVSAHLLKRLSQELPIPLENEEERLEGLKACLHAHIIDESDMASLMNRDSFYQEDCFNDALKPYAEDKIRSRVLEEFSAHSFLIDESEEKELNELIEQEIKKLISSRGIVEFDSQTIEKLKDEVVKELLPQFLALVKRKSLRDLEKTFVIDTILNEAKDSFSREIDLVFERALRSDNDVPLQTNLNAMGQGVLLKRGEILTDLSLREKILLDNQRVELTEVVNKDFTPCLSKFSPTQSYPLERHWLECEKKRMSALNLVLMKREYEDIIGQSFPLSSPMANDILSPLTFFQKCMERKHRDPTIGVESFENHIKGCRRITEFDLSYNMALAKQDDYFPLLEDGQSYREELKACYRDLIDSVEMEEFSPKDGDNERGLFTLKESLGVKSTYGSSLLSVFVPSLSNEPEFRNNDRYKVDALMDALVSKDQYSKEDWGDKLLQCEEKASLEVATAFREYMIAKIPSLELDSKGEEYEKVMRDFLDAEMVELILSLKDKINTRGSSVLALKNFVDTLSELIDQGFVYDKAATRTELIVFKNEFKSFLRWAKSSPTGISLEDASDFFKESKLSEHLSLAVLSQKVFENFERGLHEMKQNEMQDLYRSAGCRTLESYSCLNKNEKTKYRRINKKYRNLLSHAKKMTASYDFRRIMRPDSPKGAEVLSRIRELYLRPKILGTGVSQRAEEEVMRLVGEEILKDNTAGGFADLFVQEAAQYQLDIEKDRRWAITEFFWFDDKDFDWETLKQTEAGERAIAYYSRYIMLPKFLGQEQNRTTERIRREQFRRLLTSAQGQNKR